MKREGFIDLPFSMINTLTVLHVMSNSEINISPLTGWQRAEQASANMICSKSLFSKLCVHKQCSSVETLVILRAKFHVVSSLLVLKIEILMLSYIFTRNQKYSKS